MASRSSRRITFAVVAVVAASAMAHAETVSANLGLTPAGAVNSVQMTVTTNLNVGGSRNSTQTINITGNILANLGVLFDPVSQAASGIDTLELTGGHFSASNTTFVLDYGWLMGKITISGQGLGGTFDTPLPPGLVTSGAFGAADHQAIFNQGILAVSATGLIGQAFTPMNIDVSQQPIPASGSGTGTLNVGAPSISGNTATYSLTMRMPVAFDQVVYEDVAVGTASAKGQGTFEAVGTFSRSFIPNAVWNVNGSQDWGANGNWIGGIPDMPGATATFAQALTPDHAPATVKLGASRTVGTLVLSNDSQYILSGTANQPLRLDNAGQRALVRASGTAHDISSPIVVADHADFDLREGVVLGATGGITIQSGRSMTIAGAGALLVQGGISGDASTTIDVQSGALLTDRIYNGSLKLGSGTEVILEKPAVATPAAIVDSLSLAGVKDAWQAQADLTTEKLIVRSDSEHAVGVLEQITNQIGYGRNSGATRWGGQGITSAAAEFDQTRLTGLAVMLNQDSAGNRIYPDFGGQSVDGNAILIRYTLNGDMDLNGIVNTLDYARIDQGFLSGGTLKGYQYGDLDYNGVVNTLDYALIDAAFLGQNQIELDAQPVALGQQAVPEPGAIMLLGALGGVMLRRVRFSRAASAAAAGRAIPPAAGSPLRGSSDRPA